MRRKIIRVFLIAFLGMLFGSAMIKIDAEAAQKAKYRYETEDYSRTFGGIKAHVSYKKVVLEGSDPAAQKINQAITADCEEFLAGRYDIYKWAQISSEDTSDDDYYLQAKSKVTYNKKGIISIRVTTRWYAGGVENIDRYGLNFNLKTGKKITLKDVCKGTAGKIKSELFRKIRRGADSDSVKWKYLKSHKVKKMKFFLKPKNKAVVCFGPYEINYGGWYRTYPIRSKYK